MVTEVTKITLVDTDTSQANTGDSGIVQGAFKAAGYDSVIEMRAPEARVKFTDKRPSPAEAGEIFGTVSGRLSHTQSARLETVQVETMALKLKI